MPESKVIDLNLAKKTPDGRKRIRITGRSPRLIINDLIEAIRLDNEEDPRIFVRVGELVRTRHDENDRLLMEPMTSPQLRCELDQVVQCEVMRRDGPASIQTPRDIVEDIRAAGEWPFRPVKGITEVPVLHADGSIHDEGGYDPKSALVYEPQDGLVMPSVPEHPTSGDVDTARETLLEPYVDFPFVDEASRAHAVAHAITITVRALIDGSTPLFLIDKPSAGSGGSFLAQTNSMISTGRSAPMSSYVADDNEMRKQLTAEFIEGGTHLVLDNVVDPVRSSSLAKALSEPEWKDRRLGESRMVRLPIRTVIAITGNNIRLRGDIARRSVWCRLDAKVARPWRNRTYKDPNLLESVRKKRGELLAAIFTLTRAWIQEGRPEPDRNLTGFDHWSHLVGGISKVAGIPGFLENLNDLYDSIDDDSAEWEVLLRYIHALTFIEDESKNKSFTAADVARLVKLTEEEVLPADLAEYKETPKFKVKIGYALRGKEGTRFGDDGIHIVRLKDDTKKKGVARYGVRFSRPKRGGV